ncbi:helix-turn-helix domain-containing protein [Aliarcobacter vitoriensis]|uniref:AraC family transcriptional regulator n=1 Tax=Aliarcobacter vitoriensis TaxID=2011099 RepID=A0A366MXA6_9BACT|nr:AraC family transcriptional regulator [Aliarcobacter vitoriensis]RBQ30052.1 AraC family transcriptional regulator [Aliarcobacter vitoriensis]
MSSNFMLNDINSFYDTSFIKNYSITFPKNSGIMMCEKNILNDDILIYKTEVSANEELSISSHSKIDSLIINIVLDGKISYIDNNLDKIETLNKNETYIKYIDDYKSTTIVDKNSFSKGLAISIKNSFLEKNLSSNKSLLEELQNHQKSTIIHKQDNQINIKLANELFHSPFYSDLHNIYIQSKVLELIYNQFSSLLDDKNKLLFDDRVKLSSEDIDALHKARDIILVNQEFYDLTTLARKVAINEFKLKYGFRQLFNTSPGQMILEQKMIYAKKLLEKSEYSIYEISHFIGYKHQTSFTNAFIKFFGVRPKDIMLKRKYYFK